MCPASLARVIKLNANVSGVADVLPAHGVDIVVVPRTGVDGEIISASKVREALRQNDWTTVAKMVSPSTLEYLQSEDTVAAITRIRDVKYRH